MNTTKMEKGQFVRCKLEECLIAADIGVKALGYENRYDGSEFVTIYYEGGGRRAVDVSGDSKLAIIKDVLNGGHF